MSQMQCTLETTTED